MAFVTENRREEGLMMQATVADNLALAALPTYSSRFVSVVRSSSLATAVRETVDILSIKVNDAFRNEAKGLSGGNQQKVVLGKWLMTKPSILIIDEPTRGVDVGAKYEIYEIIDRIAAGGTAVLFISSEIEELMGMCDRILVMGQGEVLGSLRQGTVRPGGHPAHGLPGARGMTSNRWTMPVLRNIPAILFVLVFVLFSVLDQRFATFTNFSDITRTSAFIGIVAVGMTIVLLTGGIDLSVGATMYIAGGRRGAAPAAGRTAARGHRRWRGGRHAWGCFNAFLIARVGIVPFVATLATLTVGRGLGLLITGVAPVHPVPPRCASRRTAPGHPDPRRRLRRRRDRGRGRSCATRRWVGRSTPWATTSRPPARPACPRGA